MSELRVRLTKTQIVFLRNMLEIEDGPDAVKKFAQIMTEEKFPPQEMSKVVDILMAEWGKRK